MKVKNTIFFLHMTVVMSLFFSCKNKQIDYDSAIDSSRNEIRTLQGKYMVPGICACVSVQGQNIWCEGFGFADIENKVQVDPYTTLFRIGSVSKPFTAEALAILYEEGKISWEDPIEKHVPYFPDKGYPITIEQVAGHIAGIRHYNGNEMESKIYYPTVRDGLSIFINDPLLFIPGTSYKYSSYGWNLLSAVVEGASGQEFLSFMHERVFGPLNMKAQADFNTVEIPGRTKFYTRKNNHIVLAPEVDNSYKWAGGGFLATCEDLIKFGNAHFYPELISDTTFDILVKSQVINDTVRTGYGIGWVNRLDADSTRYYGHTGGSVGGITRMILFPDTKTVISLVSNSGNVNFQDLPSKMNKWFNAEIMDVSLNPN